MTYGVLRGCLARAALLTGLLGVVACGGASTSPSSPTSASSAAPTGVATDAPRAGSTVVPFADCSRAEFGPPLAPLNPPAGVHVYPGVPPISISVARLYQLTIATPKGQIIVCLQPELAPATVNTMVTLARNHFFDGVIFHRVVPNLVLQGGDPTGTGTGGPGFEFNDEPVRNSYVLGAVAMANQGANTNGSDFFVCLGMPSASPASVPTGTPMATASVAGRPPSSTVAQCAGLPPDYNLFGRVETGLDVAATIRPGTAMTSVIVAEQI